MLNTNIEDEDNIRVYKLRMDTPIESWGSGMTIAEDDVLWDTAKYIRRMKAADIITIAVFTVCVGLFITVKYIR